MTDTCMSLTLGEIIRRAIDHRQEIQPKQKAVDAVASLVGVEVRQVYRWMAGEAVPTLSQWNSIMRSCLYSEGYDKLKELNFPELQ